MGQSRISLVSNALIGTGPFGLALGRIAACALRRPFEARLQARVRKTIG
jgi:hypothetical protein